MRLLLYCVVAFLGFMAEAQAIVIRVELTPTLEEVDASFWPTKVVTVSSPIGTAIVHVGLGNGRDYRPKQVGPRLVDFHALAGPEPTNTNITLRDGRQVTINFKPTTNENMHTSRVEFYEPGTMPDLSDIVAEDFSVGRWITATNRVDVPRELFWQGGEYSLRLRTGHTIHTDDVVLLPVALSTDGAEYPIGELKLLDRLGRPVDTTLIYADHELLAKRAVVRRGHRVVAAFRINQPHEILKGWTLVAMPATRIARAQFDWTESPPRGPLEGNLAIAVQALGGLGNIDDGAGNDETSWALLQGFGAQATYGVSKHVSLQAALDFMRTTSVTFHDAAWDGNLGELHVETASGRLLGGVLLHTAGRRWVPFARLAMGVRFSQHERSMGSRTESEVRSGALIGFGGGLNVMLGRHAIAVLSVAYTAPIGGNDTTQVVETALSLAATWSLNRAR